MLRASVSLQSSYGRQFMKAIANVELLCNSVVALVTPDLYNLGLEAISMVKEGTEMAKTYKNVDVWPSVYTGMQVIVNRVTPLHRDNGGCPTHYDLLVSAGIHSDAVLGIKELGLSLCYSPGTLVSLSGKIFFHEVPQWTGERVCIAHFMKDKVHERLHLKRPEWPKMSDYLI
jgi:hypothetical protein